VIGAQRLKASRQRGSGRRLLRGCRGDR